MIFEYSVDLKKGYKPVMQDQEENEVVIHIQAKNRATADRMIKALLIGSTNIIDYSGVCIQE